MRNFFKELLYFSEEEKKGIFVLLILIFLVLFFTQLYSYQQSRQTPSPEDISMQMKNEAEYKAFMASIQEVEHSAPETRRWTDDKSNSSLVLSRFDPNTADSITFRKLGLPAWMARNILRYRIKGGKFHRAEEFQKVYGLTEQQYKTLLPYIQIKPENNVSQEDNRLYTATVNSAKPVFDEKYPAGTILNLNQADTTELKKIPGIGSGIARMIVGYRERLGGFYNIKQLQEIHLDFRKLEPWFHVEAKDIHPMNLNRAGIERLRSHPYINFYQAKAFVEYRKKKGMIHNLKPFSLYEEFTESDLERIAPYVCFD